MILFFFRSAPLVPQPRTHEDVCHDIDVLCNGDDECCSGICSLVALSPFTFKCTSCEGCKRSFNFFCPDDNDPRCTGKYHIISLFFSECQCRIKWRIHALEECKLPTPSFFTSYKPSYFKHAGLSQVSTLLKNVSYQLT